MPINFKPKQGRGDTGFTDIAKGKRVKKINPKIKSLAAIDELTCLLGLLKARFKKYAKLKTSINDIEKIQNNLFIISGTIAGLNRSKEIKTDTANLEKTTNELSKKTPKLKNFIICGKSETEALIHLARAKTRIAEIAVWETSNFKTSAIFLNRLSDYLFLLALKAL